MAIPLCFGKKSGGRRSARLSLQLVIHFVADPPDGQDVLGCVRVRLDLFPRLSDRQHLATVCSIAAAGNNVGNVALHNHWNPGSK